MARLEPVLFCVPGLMPPGGRVRVEGRELQQRAPVCVHHPCRQKWHWHQEG